MKVKKLFMSPCFAAAIVGVWALIWIFFLFSLDYRYQEVYKSLIIASEELGRAWYLL